MNYDLTRDDYSEDSGRQLARYEPVRAQRPLFARFRLGRMTEAELIIREARLTRLRAEETFKTEVQSQGQRIYLVYNAEVTEHDAALMADVKKRSNEAKSEILKGIDRQDAKERAAKMILDPLEAREVQKRIDSIYDYEEPPAFTSEPSSANGTKTQGKTQKVPEKESIL